MPPDVSHIEPGPDGFQRNLRAFLRDRFFRRRVLAAAVARWLPLLQICLFLMGYIWMLALPSPRLGRTTYIDENALQPGQVNVNWNWGEVHRADLYLGQLEHLVNSNATASQRAEYLKTEFEKLGLPAATQSYSIHTSPETINGTNAYSILSAPRTSGTEAMVISASWRSRTGEGDGTLNMRGVATVLALASFLKNYSLWAKDIVFVVSDGYLEGMHAWLNTYHGAVQTNMQAQPLSLASGVIWTALNIDYPGHSFSHLGVFSEGLNGLLPNQDLFNSFEIISRHTGGVPVVLYDHLDPRESGAGAIASPWLPSFIRQSPEIQGYAIRAKNVARHVKYQALGKPSGVHSLFHRFRIDAITLFAVPAVGPHGFHAIGRIVESTLRTMNNLLERLHASFFLYILTTPGTFLKIGHYLPSAVMISVGLIVGGLKSWVQAGWVQVVPMVKKQGHAPEPAWEHRDRPALRALTVILATHGVGLLLFAGLSSSLNLLGAVTNIFTKTFAFLALLQFIIWVTSWGVTAIKPQRRVRVPLPPTLKAMNLCLASTVISVTSVLNFSLAALLAIPLGLTLSLSTIERHPRWVAQGQCTAHLLVAAGTLSALSRATGGALWNWEVLGGWFSPFVCVVFVPLSIQAALVCSLPS